MFFDEQSPVVDELTHHGDRACYCIRRCFRFTCKFCNSSRDLFELGGMVSKLFGLLVDRVCESSQVMLYGLYHFWCDLHGESWRRQQGDWTDKADQNKDPGVPCNASYTHVHHARVRGHTSR